MRLETALLMGLALTVSLADAYDSLGDGYRAAGRRALEIDPHFESAKKNLAELEKQKAK